MDRDEMQQMGEGYQVLGRKRAGHRLAVRITGALLLLILVLMLAFLLYVSRYYRAGQAAEQAMQSDAMVSVRPDTSGWFFDGPGTDKALIFYPGAKVDTRAYAPLLHKLAERGIDVYLVDMPFRLAFFGLNRADQVMADHPGYQNYYIGGHSLGGAMAGSYAAKHLSELSGIAFLAAYPTSDLQRDNFRAISIYGSEDRVLNRSHLAENNRFLPQDASRIELQGANHGQFGDYGQQEGDGRAQISPEEQWERSAEFLLGFMN